jgi:acetyl esterase
MTTNRKTEVEPDVAAMLHAARQADRPSFETLSVENARAMYRAGRHDVQLERQTVAEVSDMVIATLPARLYRPFSAITPQPVILYFHGGGWVIGDLETHDGICRRLALSSGRVVVAIEYRLAPEHRFPAAVIDAISAHAALIADAEALGLDAADIAVAGDSAGGTLACVVAIDALEQGRAVPVAALLFYPVTDLRGETPSYSDVTGTPISAATMRWFRALYQSRANDASDWRASPVLALTLVGFPPTFVSSAGHDPLRDEIFAFVARLRDAGVTVEHRHLPGQIHGYLTLGRVIGEAVRTLDAAAAFATPGSLS